MSDNKLTWLENELQSLEGSRPVQHHPHHRQSAQGAWIIVDGKRVLNFCSNNYLGIADHPRLKEAAQQAIDKYGVGPAAVRSIAGTLDLHVEFERRMARVQRRRGRAVRPIGLLRQSGRHPAAGRQGRRDLHRSAESRQHHRRLPPEQRQDHRLRALRSRRRRGEDQRASAAISARPAGHAMACSAWTATSRRWTSCTKSASKYGVITMVDDAHGEGVVGRGGRGIVDHFGLHGKFDVEIGTLSKAFGVVGGVIAGKKVLVDWMRQRGRPFLFSSATTAADTAACLAAVDLLEESTELVDRLWANARLFKAEMKKLGFNTGKSETPITPVILGENQVAQQFSRKLFERGIFAMPIVFPTVPKGTARIRVMISAAHTASDLEQGLEAFQTVGKELGVI